MLGAATSSASASHGLQVGDPVYTYNDGWDYLGYETCSLDDSEGFTYKTSGTIVDGPCDDDWWKVDMDGGYPTKWFNEVYLSPDNGGP